MDETKIIPKMNSTESSDSDPSKFCLVSNTKANLNSTDHRMNIHRKNNDMEVFIIQFKRNKMNYSNNSLKVLSPDVFYILQKNGIGLALVVGSRESADLFYERFEETVKKKKKISKDMFKNII